MNGYAVVKWSPTSFKFTKFHETLDEAKAECERLCIANSEIFLVLKVVGRFQPQKPPAEWIENA